VRIGYDQQFTGTVSGLPAGQAPYLDWEVVEGTTGGSVVCKDFCDNSKPNTYRASRWPGTYHVRVKSHADPSRSATATVTTFGTFEGGQLGVRFEPPGMGYSEEVFVNCGDAGVWSGSTLTCSSDTSTPSFNEREVKTLTIALDPTLDHVASFSADYKKYALDSGTLREHHAVTGTSVPWAPYSSKTTAVFELKGTSVCSQISTFTFVEGSLNLTTFPCSEGSSIHIELYHY